MLSKVCTRAESNDEVRGNSCSWRCHLCPLFFSQSLHLFLLASKLLVFFSLCFFFSFSLSERNAEDRGVISPCSPLSVRTNYTCINVRANQKKFEHIQPCRTSGVCTLFKTWCSLGATMRFVAERVVPGLLHVIGVVCSRCVCLCVEVKLPRRVLPVRLVCVSSKHQCLFDAGGFEIQWKRVGCTHWSAGR